MTDITSKSLNSTLFILFVLVGVGIEKLCSSTTKSDFGSIFCMGVLKDFSELMEDRLGGCGGNSPSKWKMLSLSGISGKRFGATTNTLICERVGDKEKLNNDFIQ